jgi:hypothetical protein
MLFIFNDFISSCSLRFVGVFKFNLGMEGRGFKLLVCTLFQQTQMSMNVGVEELVKMF